MKMVSMYNMLIIKLSCVSMNLQTVQGASEMVSG